MTTGKFVDYACIRCRHTKTVHRDYYKLGECPVCGCQQWTNKPEQLLTPLLIEADTRIEEPEQLDLFSDLSR
jgi:hypothetical protein